MIELLWFAAGAGTAATAATAAALLWRRRSAAPMAAPARPSPPEPPPQRTAAEAELQARQVAGAVSEELASLASGVDGAAHNLVECAPDRCQLPLAAEHLLAEVHRLRRLHDKLRAFAASDPPSSGQAEVVEVIAALSDELQNVRLGLEVEATFASGLPPVALPPQVLHKVLLFACGAMLRSERGATHLSVFGELSLGDDDHAVRIELMLEWPGDPGPTPGRTTHDPCVAIALLAASRLARTHGAEVTLSYPPGRAVKTLVVLPAARPAAGTPPLTAEPGEAIATPRPAAAEPAAVRHGFGGALVVEADPAVRTMLARELRQAGRAVFACADGTAARTFLEATPDRFELLFVDHHDRLDHKDGLGEAVHRLAPELKVCVLGTLPSRSAELWPGVHSIEKPFGRHELRRALASVLDAG